MKFFHCAPLAALFLAAFPAQGLASPPEPSQAEGISMSSAGRSSPIEFVSDQAVIPGFWQLGTSVSFASGASPSDSGMALPSTTRLSLDGRLSLGESFELTGGLALPPKRSEVTDDPPLFGGHLMARRAVHRRQALYASVSADRVLQVGGPRDDGLWAQAAAGWDGRSFMDRHRRWLAFSWNLGVGAGQAWRAGGDQAPWLLEGIAGLGLNLLVPLDDEGVGLAFGSDFRFPLADGGRAYWAAGAPEINSQTRVDLYTTMFLTLATGWSITATLARRDRGEVDSPESILPVLDGGFDQTQFLIGFSYAGVRESDDQVLMAE